MSGSSSRFPGRPEPAMPVSAYDPYDDPVTGVRAGAGHLRARLRRDRNARLLDEPTPIYMLRRATPIAGAR